MRATVYQLYASLFNQSDVDGTENAPSTHKLLTGVSPRPSNAVYFSEHHTNL